MNAKCGNCRFWGDIRFYARHEKTEEGVEGQCLRYAPTPELVTKIDERFKKVAWPITGGGCFCGDWQLREES